MSGVVEMSATSTVQDTLRDPIWQFVGAVIALVSLVSMIIAELSRRQEKALSYRIVARSPLPQVKSEEREQLGIGSVVGDERDYSVVGVRMLNSGGSPIPSSEYESSIEICLNEKANIEIKRIQTDPPRSEKQDQH